jgi:putative ABC transport system permease protein
MKTIDISWINLLLGYLLLVVPILFMWYYRTGLIKDIILSSVRMGVQLFLVGLYLQYLFVINNLWINIAWVFLMIIIATITTTKRSGLKFRLFSIPIITGLLVAVCFTDAIFLGLIIRLDNFFDVRYFIPITGMMIGNCMERNIIALNSYYNTLIQSQSQYNYSLAAGATRKEALNPYMNKALKDAFNPLIAQMAVMGLISLPGTMTGQILGGSDPSIAIKYQILIMICIFTATIITVVTTIFVANKFAFDGYDNIQIKKLKKETA